MRRLILMSMIVLTPSLALAHDDLDAALRAFEHADFARAVRAFDRAEASEHLTRDELETLLRGRALAHHAAGDVGAAEEDLSAWLSLAPGATLDDTTPPAVRRLLERVRGEVAPLSLEASAIPGSQGFAISARVTGDVASLVRSTRIHYASGSEVETIEGDHAEVALATGTLRYWVEAIGPGGAIVATAGSESSPLEAARVGAASAMPEDPTPVAPPPDETALHVGITVGVVLAVAAVATVIAIVLTQPSSDTQLSGPMRVSLP